MHRDQEVLMMSIRRFYGKPDNARPLVAVVEGTSPASLRLIEWFITNHAKRHDVIVTNRSDQINVHHSYRAALKTFSKEQFDPFRRHERIRFVYGSGDDDAIETTVGQLNFFKWAIETGVLSYIQENKGEIEQLMVECGAAKRTSGGAKAVGSKAGAGPPPHEEIGTIHHKIRTTLSFD